MMNREALIKLVGELSTETLLHALSASGVDVGGGDDSGGDPTLSGMAADDGDNRIPGWSELTINRKPDDRPTLSDKPFLKVTDAKPKAGGSHMGHMDNNTQMRPFGK